MEWNNWVLSWFKSINTDSHVFTVYLVSLTVAMSKMLPSVPDLSGSQPENTAGRDAAPSRARTHACLPSLSRNTWKLGDWTAAMTLATRAIHDHIIAAFLLCRHANRLGPSRIRTRTARACYAATGQESLGVRLKRRTARPQWGQWESRQRSEDE